MKTSTKIICIVLIASVLAMFGGVTFAAIRAIQIAEEQSQKIEAIEDKVNDIIAKAEEKIAQTEQDRLNLQEQYKDLLEILPERPLAPSRPELPESPDLSPSGSTGHNFVDRVYEQIIAIRKGQAEICELCVGDSIRPEGSAELNSDQCYVYSSDEEVVTVSEDYTITAVALGETYVLFSDGETFLVYLCIVTEE